MFLYSSCTEFKGDHGFLRFCWFLKPGDISNIYMDFLFYTFPTLLFFQNSLEIYCCLFICYFSALQLIYLLMSYFRFVTSFEKYEFLYAIQRYTQAERERELIDRHLEQDEIWVSTQWDNGVESRSFAYYTTISIQWQDQFQEMNN